MKKRVVWLVVTGWMVAALLLASCAPAVVKEEAEKVAPPVKEKEEVVVPKEEVVPKEVVTPAIEKPRYGGTFIRALLTQPVGFDDVAVSSKIAVTAALTQDSLLTGDWAKGPAGSGEIAWDGSETFIDQFQTGALAESWEFPDPNTVIFHLKKGIRFALDPKSEASRLVGGREIVADDVAFSITRYFEDPRGWGYRTYGKWWWGAATDRTKVAAADRGSATATDKYTVVLKGFDRYDATAGVWQVLGDWHWQWPPEVINKYGDANDWRNVVGTGPFMLKEYVGASSVTFVRNPNYWMKDPVGPGKGNQLPYLDGVKLLVIPDYSTRMAALRTAKIDALDEIEREDFEQFRKSKPELLYTKYHLASTYGIFGQFSGSNKPWEDIRVRRALHMAIDLEAIAKYYYDGDAIVLSAPSPPIPWMMDAYIPLEKLPPDAKQLFEYNPAKARQLLAEAGYPQGFKTEIVLRDIHVDLMSIVKEDWAKIGVDVKLDVKDSTTYTAIGRQHSHPYMYFGSWAALTTAPFKVNLKVGMGNNYSNYNDPVYEALQQEMWKWEYIGKPEEQLRVKKEQTLRVLEQAAGIQLPWFYYYRMWYPWLKNYHGEWAVGYMDTGNFVTYIWLDQELKKAMTR